MTAAAETTPPTIDHGALATAVYARMSPTDFDFLAQVDKLQADLLESIKGF